MVLSDATIARYLADGRIEIDPYDEALLQPSSVDVRVDRLFRVFHNNRYPFIDVKVDQSELTELVEVDDAHPFVLHPGEFVLGSTLERVRLPDDLVARLEGKALALDTEVPTSEGWRTMADVEPGDLVFDELGFPCVVLNATPPMADRPCREVVFSDGTTVVADVDHLWRTVDARRQTDPSRSSDVLTTGRIAETLRHGGGYAHHVPSAGAVWYPERELPIDPYALGVRVGDGASTPAGAACAGVAAWRTRRDEREESPRGALRERGLPGDEHIPGEYLRASIEQRSELLDGLTDTAGHVDELGRCALTTLEEPLALQYAELVASLGFGPTLARRGQSFEVRFTRGRPASRAITEVREVESVPVRCIEVSSASGMFLVTRSFVPTHNSSLGRLGLLIHSTAGFIDPGWDGHVTLELSNVANLPITIYPGMKIGQISFMQMTEPARTPYGSSELGSKYKGQQGPTPSRYFKNFESGE
ncbi:MAG TPA: dCTP deaminase [Gaiellaceae bacterium]|nr:dCTP deaminase [Gaiellaceae bacterium]